MCIYKLLKVTFLNSRHNIFRIHRRCACGCYSVGFTGYRGYSMLKFFRSEKWSGDASEIAVVSIMRKLILMLVNYKYKLLDRVKWRDGWHATKHVFLVKRFSR